MFLLQNLSYGFARELDHRNQEKKAAGQRTPYDTFDKMLYRQPSLTEKEVYPEPYRNDGSYDALRTAGDDDAALQTEWFDRRGSISINVHELEDEAEENQKVLEQYFKDVVLPLAQSYVNPAEANERDSVHNPLSTSTDANSNRDVEQGQAEAEAQEPFEGRRRR